MNHQTPERHDRQEFASTQAIDLLKRAYPIQAVLARYGIALTGASPHRMACCPFHEDTHPSMGVFLDTNRFFCFRCGAKGDVLDLLQRLEGISFREAVARLGGHAPDIPSGPEQWHTPLRPTQTARRVAGPSVERDATAYGEVRGMGEEVTSASGTEFGSQDANMPLTTTILTAAAALYQAHLLRTPHALAYLKARGIPPAVARRARLGYADATTLQVFVGQDTDAAAVARKVGLLDAAGQDRMRGRIVIPEFRAGRCVWMVGRLIPSISTPTSKVAHSPSGASSLHAGGAGGSARNEHPKYLGVALPKPLLGLGLMTTSPNLPQLHRVASYRNDQQQRDRHDWQRVHSVLVVEGPFDLLTAIAWHLPALCVALGGTYANARQAAEVVALANGGPIWLALDADAAGDAGATRLQTRLSLAGCSAPIQRLPIPEHAKDLSDIVASPGARRAVILALTNTGARNGKEGH